jgi:shikimate 5-dehydrogenase
MCHWFTGAYTGSAEFTLPPEMLEQRPVVFDAAYKPARTALLNQVKGQSQTTATTITSLSLSSTLAARSTATVASIASATAAAAITAMAVAAAVQ